MDNLEMVQDKERKIQFLQYVNTAILTFIGTVATIILVMISNVQEEQVRTGESLIRFQVLQDHNTQQLDDVDARVKILEVANLQDFKNWVDNNYVRKPQK